MAKLTKPIIAVNIDGTVRVLNQDPNATHFNWYTRELLSYSITSPSYDVVVAGTNESTTALPNSSYTNRVYITESYRDIRKFTSFKLYEAGSSAVDVTELYVTKISDFEYSISIPNVEHDYIITWGVGAITYTITSSLTNCVANKSDESYVGGTAVNIVITAATGYTFDSSLGGTIGLSVGEVDKTSEYMTRSSDNKKVTIAIPAIAAVGNIIYAAGAVEEIVQLATPTIAMNADGKTLEITDVENATSYDVYVDGTMKTNVASVPTTTTLDLSTLSDIVDGAHTVKVKAKADRYIDSEFSNEVSYTKTPARSFANDSPDVIQAAVIDGTAIDLYNVGDQKEITLTDGSTITIRIVNNSASMYQLSDGTRNSGFVVEFVDCFKVLQYMNSSRTKTGGWNSSYMRNTMMNTIFNLLPSEWQNVIPSVNVISDNGAYPSPKVVTTSDKLFLPAEREVSRSSNRDSDVNASSKVEWEALQNWNYYSSGGSKAKKYNNQNKAYWLRSAAWVNSSKFCIVSDGGGFSYTFADETLGVAPAFCL